MNQLVIDHQLDYDFDPISINGSMNNRLFCTFTPEDTLEETLDNIQSRYTIMYGKIFVLKSHEQGECICTYNVDLGNVSDFLDNTILMHRKKDTNTLYTINALNILIKQLNGGILDTTYRIPWEDYQNTALLTKGAELRRLTTKLHRILEL
jgi:hypothetical protein